MTSLVKQEQKTLSDIGTRYEHFRDFADTLETGIDVLQKKAEANKNRLTIEDNEKLVKMLITYEIINRTIDVMSKVKDDITEYKLFRMVDSIPAAKDLEGYIPYERLSDNSSNAG